jgi:hypothetical protein
VNKKKQKSLWEPLLSIREHRKAFHKRLSAMIALASDHLGKNSNGLQHVDMPEGKV